MQTLNRRTFLQAGSLSGLCLLANPLGLRAAPDPQFQLRPLKGRAFLVSSSYSNVLGMAGDEGVLLIGGVREADAKRFLQIVDDYTGGAPISLVYNTHWHWDQTGSNQALRARGAGIVAHENTRLWLGNDFYVDWEDRHYQARPQSAWPTDTFYDTDRRDFAGESIESALLFQAHTDGDIYIRLREDNILAVGDLVADDSFPLPDPVTGGWIGGLTNAQETLLSLSDQETLIIPGSGNILSRAQLQQQYAMLVAMRERIFELARQGKGPEEMLAAGVAEGFEAWGDPRQFIYNVYPGLGRHYRQVDGVV